MKKSETKGKQNDAAINQHIFSELQQHIEDEEKYEGRDKFEMDIDRMINEGLGGGLVTDENGLIESTTTDTMEDLKNSDS